MSFPYIFLIYPVYKGRTPKYWNYLLKGERLVVWAYLVSILETYPYQGACWHCSDSLCLTLVIFFEDFLNMFAHFIVGDLQAHLSIQH